MYLCTAIIVISNCVTSYYGRVFRNINHCEQKDKMIICWPTDWLNEITIIVVGNGIQSLRFIARDGLVHGSSEVLKKVWVSIIWFRMVSNVLQTGRHVFHTAGIELPWVLRTLVMTLIGKLQRINPISAFTLKFNKKYSCKNIIKELHIIIEPFCSYRPYA